MAILIWEDVYKNGKGLMEADFISLHISFQEDIFYQLSNINALLIVRRGLTK